MPLPKVSRATVLQACVDWDRSGQRDLYNWRVNTYVLVWDGKYYPPKVIVSLATGRGVDTFSGGRSGANRYLQVLGFTVTERPTEDARRAGPTPLEQLAHQGVMRNDDASTG